LLVNEESLGIPAPEVMCTHFLKIALTGRLCCTIGGTPDDRTNAGLSQINECVVGSDVVFVLIPFEIALNAVGEVGIARLPTVTAKARRPTNAPS